MLFQNEKWKKAKLLAKNPTAYTGLTLLFIALALIAMPNTLQPMLKDVLMVAFACTALLPGAQ